MLTKEIATIQFVDDDSKEEALAIVRTIDHRVALCLSLHTNGDVEVIMQTQDCQKLLQALQEALSAANTHHESTRA
jgi:hypothetical protein